MFSKVLAFRAPYFSTINPLIRDLHAGFCKVEIKDRRSIRNHLKTINAGAMCTVSELAGGLAVEASLPDGLRWIPKKMSVQYLKKAKGLLVATCTFDPAILLPGDVGVFIEIKDLSSDVVLLAKIHFYISRRARARGDNQEYSFSN